MRKKLFCKRNGKYLKKEEKIHWSSELRISFSTSILFLLFTTFVVWMVHNISPGRFVGEDLDRYFKQKLVQELNSSISESEIIIEQREVAIASDAVIEDTVIVCGAFDPKSDGLQAGRFISIWERGSLGFWNELFETETSYDLVFLRISEEACYNQSTLMCAECAFEDLNDDGLNDVRVKYNTRFADRESTANVFLLRNNHGWDMVSPDFSNIEREILAQIDQQGIVMIDKFSFIDPKCSNNQQYVYSLAMYGKIYVIENPLWGKHDYLYYIAVNNGTALLKTDHCALVMMRFTSDHKLVRDPNWNNGQVYVASTVDFDFRSFTDEHWGIQIDDIVYYGEDVK
ncbi:MAG: hypothetical protein UHS47_04475 [Oscillospiraceae bacterium]|nr:hypothetical protein [Oscillospiraceae bacterium]